MTYEGTRSTNTNTPCPQSYSPASQRSRFSQPNLPTLMIPYSEHGRHHHQLTHNQHHHHLQHHHLHHHRSKVVSPDRRIRMSHPTLHSSFFGINFVGGIKGNRRLSYTSLRTSGDNSIHSQIQQDRLSSPNVHAFGTTAQGNIDAQIINGEYRRDLVLSQLDICRIVRSANYTGKRERLSQPTLVTGDYYPSRMQHQRLSQPCLLSTWNEKPINLHSPMKHKCSGSNISKISQRDRMSQLDFGGIAKFKYVREFMPSKKFNRDRFSIPELETQNDLRLIAGTPKQRYSLDSQLNPEGNRTRRLLPIASSPISEHQTGHAMKDNNNKEVTSLMAGERLENIIVATATPIVQPSERHLFTPILKSTPTLLLPVRERMSVPEIRNASLRRLLDPPMKQRHSITGNLRQFSTQEKGDERKKTEVSINMSKTVPVIEHESKTNQPQIEIISEPKHFQRHYSYTYDSKDDTNEVIGKLGIVLPRKKYLESNFDEHEQVITTVIETEMPLILGSPKYSKKTHVYASETPKWMKKCLECDNLGKKKVHDSEVLDDNQKNVSKMLIGKKNSECVEHYSVNLSSGNPPEHDRSNICLTSNRNDRCKIKNTCVRMKSAGNTGINRYEVTIDADWYGADECDLSGHINDTDSEDSTSV